MKIEQFCELYNLKQRLELADLIQNASDERVRLLMQIIEADPQLLAAALSAAQAERDR